MIIEKGAVRFPGLDGGEWIQGKVSTLDCDGLVTLVDFWDYTCINCLRALPYVKAWHERYAHLGLLVIGVHAPEFEFARDRRNVQCAVHAFDIPYPVVLDNQYRIWNAFATRCWPAKYVFDANGFLRCYHFGEGEYHGLERAIQSLLQERNGGGEFAGVVEPIRESDRVGAICQQSTPELHLGLKRGRIGNAPENLTPGSEHCYPMPAKLTPETVYLAGCWSNHPQYSEYLGEGEGHILVHYTASEVNLVMQARRDAAVYLIQDAKPVRREDAGDDIHFEHDHAVVRVREPRMYQLIKNASFGSHFLSLSTVKGRLQAYAFTFVPCVKAASD